MKTIQAYIFLLIAGIGTIQAQDTTQIEGDFQEVKITGIVKSLKVVGEDDLNRKLIISGPSGIGEYFKYTLKRGKLSIELLAEKSDIDIQLPSLTELTISPNSVAYEGTEYWKDERQISVEGMSGTVSVEADGYGVSLLRNTNSMNILSYMDIKADSIILLDGNSILLDSYLGNVDLSLMPPLDALITLEALDGITMIDPLIDIQAMEELQRSLQGKVGEGKSSILLHSEKGHEVRLQMQQLEAQLSNLNFEKIEASTDEYQLYQNFPNPWRRSTEIVFSVPKDVNVNLTFYDPNGALLKAETIKAKEGINKYQVKRREFKHRGTIFYKMEIGKFQSTKSMILLD